MPVKGSKKCPRCKKFFKPTHHRQKYCPDPCAKEMYYERRRKASRKYDRKNRKYKFCIICNAPLKNFLNCKKRCPRHQIHH